jgi:type IV pilus assembly protein PilN
MIRINLLGQPRPKAARRAVPPAATTLVFILLGGFLFGAIVLYVLWYQDNAQLVETRLKIEDLQREKQTLQQLQAEVDLFEKQKAILDQRYAIIEELQRNRTGGQELLTMIANSVVRTDALWLTSMQRRGNALTLEGTAASINSVANFITQLRRSGYFDKVEIKESRQDERNPNVATFNFTLTAEFVLPPATAPAAPAAKRS